MAPIIGFSLLLLLILLNLITAVLIFFRIKKAEVVKTKTVKLLTLAQLLTAILTQLCLTYCYVVSNYSVLNVYQNSHALKPLLYKLVGSFSNHEGSMLLLIMVLCAYSTAFAFFGKLEQRTKIIAIAVQSLICFSFCCFTAFTSNPFELLAIVPKAGLGMNPILQDIGLALHPPVLYTGYLGFSLIFSASIAGLLTEKIDAKFASAMSGWLHFAFGVLTLGIGLGSWWAYRELGWGGYWFWDPVENVSLMPWIGALALLHSFKVLEKTNRFQTWSALLSLLTFILCLLGIFLVRSGVLTSVHSFAVDGKRGFFIILILAAFGIAAMTIFGLKAPKLDRAKPQKKQQRKIFLISINNYLLMIFLFIVVFGTIYPLLTQLFFNQFISVGPQYYNWLIKFLVVPAVIFIIYSHINSKSKSSANSKPSILGHSGIGLVIIGVIATSYFGQTKEVNLKKGEEITIAGHRFQFDNLEYKLGKNFVSRVGVFTEVDSGVVLKPELRYYPISDQTTYEAAIKHSIAGDLYLVIGNKDEQNYFAVRAYSRPLIWMIWMGCLLILSASFLKIIKLVGGSGLEPPTSTMST